MLESKYIIFFIGSVVCVPAGIVAAVNSRKIHDFVFMFLVFGTTQPGSLFGLPTDINFLSREWYRGTTRGIEISYLDLLAIILLISSIVVRRREGRPLFWPPSLGLILLYCGYCTVNVLVVSDPRLFGIFELTKIIRGIILFLAVAVYMRSSREILLLLWAMVFTVYYESAMCFYDRYYLHKHRVQGTLGHPNNLSTYCLQFIPVFVMAVFAGNTPQKLRWACIIGFFGAAGCIILSISRMGFAALILLSGISFAFAIGARLTPARIGLAVLGVLLTGLMMLKAWDNLATRYSEASIDSYTSTELGGRGQYWRYAFQMVSEHPLGVGLNNWSYSVTNEYGPRAGIGYVPYMGTAVPPSQEIVAGHNLQDRAQAAPAHTLIGLTLGELGWPGCLIFLALWARWLWISTSVSRRSSSLSSSVGLGILLTLVSVFLHCLTEWVYRITPIYFMTHIMVGTVAAVYAVYLSERSASRLPAA